MVGIVQSQIVAMAGLVLALASGPVAAHCVTSVVADPALPVRGEPLTLTVRGVFTDGCERTTSATAQEAEYRILIRVVVVGPSPGTPCPAVLTPFEQSVEVSGLASGKYVVDVDLLSTDAGLESFPGVRELYVHDRRVPYKLLADSWFMNDCPICNNIPIQLPMTGRFDLLPIGPGSVFDFYDVDRVSFHADGYDVTARGRYQKSDPPLAGQQCMILDTTVNKEAGLVLESRLVPFTGHGMWPPIDIEVSEVTTSNVRVYRMRIMALPVPPIPDLDGDGDVDGIDLAGFASCHSGPAVPYPHGCDRADFDGDNDVDQSDFGALQKCFRGPNQPADPECTSKTPHVAARQRTDCKAGNPDQGYPGCGKDELDLVPAGDALLVTHRNIVYNCCLNGIGVDLEAWGRHLRLIEKEDLAAPCDCLCCYDTTTTIGGLVPGVYTVEYCWQDDKSGYTCLIGEVTLAP